MIIYAIVSVLVFLFTSLFYGIYSGEDRDKAIVLSFGLALFWPIGVMFIISTLPYNFGKRLAKLKK